VTVEVTSNTKAVDFYKKLGFVDRGEQCRKQGEKMLSSGKRMSLVGMVWNSE
jgi:ribosomal protein S18 acetylase RimI-like enzyme